VVVVGNRKGKVGLGTGKANEVQIAVGKAVKAARRHMINVPLTNHGTIPHEVRLKFKAAKLLIMPASEGTGIIAGGALRTVFDHAGVKNVLSKRFGTTNKLVNAQAIIKALKKLRPVRGKVVDPDAPKADKSAPEVQAISKEDLAKRQDVARRAGSDVQA
jgi:small subunit ribosomal protein S5